MTTAAAIDAQVVDIQNDRLHKGFMKVTLHIAVERGKHLTDVLGTWPTYTDPVPVALARLEIGARGTAPVDGDATNPPQPPDVASASGNSRPSKVSPDKRLVQQASIMCTKPEFRLFLEKTFLPSNEINKCSTEDQAREIVRHVVEVESISEIIVGTPAADRWERLIGRFTAWDRGLPA